MDTVKLKGHPNRRRNSLKRLQCIGQEKEDATFSRSMAIHRSRGPVCTGRKILATLASAFILAALFFPLSIKAQEDTAPDSAKTSDSSSASSAVKEEKSLQPVSIDEGELGLDYEKEAYGNIEEINIVGQTQNLIAQDDATSAVGFNEDDLLMEGINDIQELSNYTPNLEIKTAFAAVNPTLFIRGVGLDDFNANSASAVSVYQDGIYMNSPAGQLFGLYDVQHIDVLRGPQPTLTNASAGAIVVRSRLPSQNLEAHLTTTFGTYGTKEFQGALNVPISESVAARAAFQARLRDGTTYNACPDAIRYGRSLDLPERQQNSAMGQCRFAAGITETGFPPGPNYFWDGSDMNNVENWAGRFLVSARMPLPDGQEVDWLFNVNGGQNKSLASQYQHTGMVQYNDGSGGPGASTVPLYYDTLKSGGPATDFLQYTQDFTRNDNYAGEYDRIGTELLDIIGGSATGTWQATDTLSVQSVTGYFWHDRATYANDDAGPKNWLNNDYTDQGWQISQEMSLTWLWGDSNEAGLGGTYLKEDLAASNIFRDDSAVFAPSFSQKYTQDTTQWAVWGTSHIELLENLDLDMSYRYNSATKTMENLTEYLINTGAGTESNQGRQTGTWAGSTGEVALTYNFSSDKSVYVKYSRGWKPGHFNANTLRSTQPVSSVRPEKINSYEAGIRTQWFDGLLTANLTGFKYAYEDLQVFQVTVDSVGFVLRRLINSREADIWGLEWEVSAEPIEGLSLTLNGGYLDSQYTDFGTTFERSRYEPGVGRVTYLVDVDYSGNRLIASPEWSAIATVEYTLNLSTLGTIRPRMTMSYRDSVFFDPNEGCGAEGNIPQCFMQQPSLFLLNAALTWTSADDRVEITGFVRNILNEEYKVQSFDLTSQRRLLLDVYGTPRIAGAMITLRY